MGVVYSCSLIFYTWYFFFFANKTYAIMKRRNTIEKTNELDKLMLGLKIASVVGTIGLVSIWYYGSKMIGDVEWIK